jgi:hypothetical protein
MPRRHSPLTLLVVLLAIWSLQACGIAYAADKWAIESTVRRELGDAGGIPLARVEVEQINGDYARAITHPSQPDLYEPEVVFLRRDNAGWVIVNYGTAFGREDYEVDEIPTELWVR